MSIIKENKMLELSPIKKTKNYFIIIILKASKLNNFTFKYLIIKIMIGSLQFFQNYNLKQILNQFELEREKS